MVSRQMIPLVLTSLLVLSGCAQTGAPATPPIDVRFATPAAVATSPPAPSPTVAPSNTPTFVPTSLPTETPAATATNTVAPAPTLAVPTATAPPATATAMPTNTSVPPPATATVVATSTPRPAALNPTVTPTGPQFVTLADNGKTINLVVGQSFLLNLGDSYSWSPVVADQSIVSRVIGIAVIRGAQGVYVAHRAGQTTLTAVGDPPCRQSTPACAAPSLIFTVTLVVH